MQQEQKRCRSSKTCSLPRQHRFFLEVATKRSTSFPAINQEMVLITNGENVINWDNPLVILPPRTDGVSHANQPILFLLLTGTFLLQQ